MSKFQLPTLEEMMLVCADDPSFKTLPGEKIRYEPEGQLLLTFLDEDEETDEMCLNTGATTEEEAIGGLVNNYVEKYAKIDHVIYRLIEIFGLNISIDEIRKSRYEIDGWGCQYYLPGGRIYYLNAAVYFVQKLDLGPALDRYVIFGDVSLLHQKGVYVLKNNGANELTLLFADGLIQSMVQWGEALIKVQSDEFRPQSITDAEELLKAAERVHIGLSTIEQQAWREKALVDLQGLQAKQRAENIKHILKGEKI